MTSIAILLIDRSILYSWRRFANVFAGSTVFDLYLFLTDSAFLIIFVATITAIFLPGMAVAKRGMFAWMI